MNDPAFFGPNKYNCKDFIVTLPIRLHFRKKEGKERKTPISSDEEY